jgi:predicted phosphodiesterase
MVPGSSVFGGSLITRVAALYDIHGNLPALEAVVEEIRHAGVDQIVIGGDVLPGPMPRETLTRLRDLDLPIHFIYGNGDRDVLAAMRGEEPVRVPLQFRDTIRWNAQQLGAEHEVLLARWPATLRLHIDGIGEVLFCHATPRSDVEIFTRLTPDDRLLPVFQGSPATVVCGHTHMPFDRMVGNTRVVNAGSLGPAIEPRHTLYDLVGAADRIRSTAYPQAQDFATRYVLEPPSEAEMLAVFGRAELPSAES